MATLKYGWDTSDGDKVFRNAEWSGRKVHHSTNTKAE
jgi:hypothetical protein